MNHTSVLEARQKVLKLGTVWIERFATLLVLMWLGAQGHAYTAYDVKGCALAHTCM